MSIYLFSVGYVFGFEKILHAFWEPVVCDYLSFIILIAALFIISGGIFVDFPNSHGAIFNVCFLFVGSIIAGLMGTACASSLLIRPFLRANQERKYKTHLMIFFIFLISNIGGAATPLGDPPLFMGFMKGIDFFWFPKHLYPILLITTASLCVIFFMLDLFLIKKETTVAKASSNKSFCIIHGKVNIFLILAMLVIIITCDFPGEFNLYGDNFRYSTLLRNILFIGIAYVSCKITSPDIYKKNYFNIDPIKEIAELFLGIFVTVTPIIHILHAGVSGQFKWIFDWIAPGGDFIASRCFWISGLLSSVLDNAPTFLIFFHLTSGDPNILMTEKAHILYAFSISTVFMGALTYIGNAPNLMVQSISKNSGIKTPSFFGYMFWSFTILLPIFIIISYFL